MPNTHRQKNLTHQLVAHGVNVQQVLLLDQSLLFNPRTGRYAGLGVEGFLRMGPADTAEVLALLLDRQPAKLSLAGLGETA